jgi:glycosyltransferase involved in cell wall biosynthesis
MSTSPLAGIEVVEPPLLVPRRWGGHRVLGWWLRRRLTGLDVLWVNDPVAGQSVLRAGIPTVYDVTDDWRSMPQDEATRRRLVAAEDELARRATTVVCSQALADRWRTRYRVEATVLPNAVDTQPIRAAVRRTLDGDAPHAMYIGTLHTNRFDVDLTSRLARTTPGSVHLVGPDHLDSASRAQLTEAGVLIHGPVRSAEVPSWLVSADVLICPHVVDDFTLSLDAIKAHEYLATDRPVVATPSCGFQSLAAEGLAVADRSNFVAAVTSAVGTGPFDRPAAPSWADRATGFGVLLTQAGGR